MLMWKKRVRVKEDDNTDTKKTKDLIFVKCLLTKASTFG